MKLMRPVVLLVSTAALAAACGGATQGASGPSQDGSTATAASATPAQATADQANDGGGVTVKATWAGTGDGLRFVVAMETHSVDLDGLDLRSATLRNDRGEARTGPTWDAPKGGHHRSGTLAFDGDVQTFLAGTTWIELIVPDIAGIPTRVLRWQAGP